MKDLIVSDDYIRDFLKESLMIEGITRNPTEEEIVAVKEFIFTPKIKLEHLVELVKVLDPKALLRDTSGLDVQVANHRPPRGGDSVVRDLSYLLDEYLGMGDNVKFHLDYENLHPFTDCNGRSGRVLWLWSMVHSGHPPKLSFLHHFYLQTFQYIQGEGYEYPRAPRAYNPYRGDPEESDYATPEEPEEIYGSRTRGRSAGVVNSRTRNLAQRPMDWESMIAPPPMSVADMTSSVQEALTTADNHMTLTQEQLRAFYGSGQVATSVEEDIIVVPAATMDDNF